MNDLSLPIYLDYSATTPVDERVAKKMVEYMTFEGKFGNPASRSHQFGWDSEKAIDTARQQVADLINADPREIVWTSGATESNNLAIKGVAHFYQKKGKHIVTVKTEHKAVLDTCRQLEREGRTLSQSEIDEIRIPVLQEYERTASAYYSTSHLWDDGIIDPTDTRNSLAIALSAALNAPFGRPDYGVFRL